MILNIFIIAIIGCPILNCMLDSKGVVRNWELARTDPDEIKENVPMITDVHRIVVKRNNLEVKTNTLILTFNTPKIPDSLKICYLNIPVSQYVPNPIRCYKWPCNEQM